MIKPASREHRPDGDEQETTHLRVTESREDGETENNEISNRADERERNASEVRVWAAQHFKAVGRSAADHSLTTERLGREIGCIGQTG